MKESVTVAAAQLDCLRVAEDEDYGIVGKAVKNASAKGADFLCLPELCSSGYDVFDRLPALAQHLTGPYITTLRRLAREHKIHIVTGFPERKGRLFHNSSVLIDSTGKIAGRYRKTHLWNKEREYYTRGGTFPVFPTRFGVCGIEICYDLEFPEPTRVLAVKGAEFVFCPTNNFRPWEEYWDVYLKARAIENGVFIVGANRIGLDGDYDFFGKSAIVAPDGKVLAQAGGGDEVIVASLERSVLQKARSRIAYLKERVPSLYGPLTRQRASTRR